MFLQVYRDYLGEIQLVGLLSPDGRFAYDEGYLGRANAHALSFSLPLQEATFSQAQALPYFKGLLPEGRALAALAARLGRAEEDYIGILAECGLDCIGDIVLKPEDYQGLRSYKKIGIKELEEKLAKSNTVFADVLTETRLSLAGTQDKIGLFIDGGEDEPSWYLPEGGAPSNCILKAAQSEYLPDLMLAEHLSMACASACGLNVAETRLVNIGQDALLIKRFDRTEKSEEVIDGHAAPTRRHQEDFTQILGLVPSSKYVELHEGTAKAIAAFLRNNSSAPALDIESLLEIGIFNYAIGNADNHLKNSSVLYSSNWREIRLAPAYDLVPTTYYARFSRNMGMALGSTRNIDAVMPEDLKAFASQIDVSERMLKKVAKRISETLLPALRNEARKLDGEGFPSAYFVADNMEEDMAPRLKVLGKVYGNAY